MIMSMVRPAVTTSPEYRRSGGRPAAAPRDFRAAAQQCARNHRAQRSATLRAQHRPGGASSSASYARPCETKREKRRSSSAITCSRRAEWSGAKARNKNARGGRKRSPKAAQSSALPAVVLRSGSRTSTLQAAQRARSWREHRAAARAQSLAVEGSPWATASDGLNSLNFDSLNSEIQQVKYNYGNTMFSVLPRWHLCLAPTGVSRTRRFSVDCGSYANPAGTKFRRSWAAAAAHGGGGGKVRRLSCRVSMTFRVVRTNQYNQDLGLIHSTNGNHLESPKEGSSIDHQVTIYLHAQNITMFPTNETWLC
ncbi:hypothetical protein F511_23093 [Dorcoceras hygrometricum]|uniref:Uncharacterized protein n=1 Tax=Dorcoceras hygrometricum TaxID=472368 RepID=A0A2Z7AWW7_9LAMI|nr:hypothetical protein F511_23093 [Dorcoceras hygrometricum]